ncbi:MAG TPA: hypothetical protein VK206_00340, partial [Anaerolineales bacterium]|nr:hypothetical protein [Anaerolineales bacterium]
INQLRANYGMQKTQEEENHLPKAKTHACKASQREYQLARDRLQRAERDLAETAAFIAASITTVTAIQAVISLARDKLELSREILQLAFQSYVALFVLILLFGALRIRDAIQRRTRAEKDMDQTKKGIFEFCDTPEWPKLEE